VFFSFVDRSAEREQMWIAPRISRGDATHKYSQPYNALLDTNVPAGMKQQLMRNMTRAMPDGPNWLNKRVVKQQQLRASHDSNAERRYMRTKTLAASLRVGVYLTEDVPSMPQHVTCDRIISADAWGRARCELLKLSWEVPIEQSEGTKPSSFVIELAPHPDFATVIRRATVPADLRFVHGQLVRLAPQSHVFELPEDFAPWADTAGLSSANPTATDACSIWARIYAANELGQSDVVVANDGLGVPFLERPLAPAHVTASLGEGPLHFVLRWKANDSKATVRQPVDRWIVRIINTHDPNCGQHTLAVPPTQFSVDVHAAQLRASKRLRAGHAYRFSVHAENSVGISEPVDANGGEPLRAVVAPPPPTDVSVTRIGAALFRLEWTEADGPCHTDSFVTYASTDGTFAPNGATAVSEVSNAALEHVHSQLIEFPWTERTKASANVVWFGVRGRNGAGESPISTVSLLLPHSSGCGNAGQWPESQHRRVSARAAMTAGDALALEDEIVLSVRRVDTRSVLLEWNTLSAATRPPVMYTEVHSTIERAGPRHSSSAAGVAEHR
jgi:hypothetical protein